MEDTHSGRENQGMVHRRFAWNSLPVSTRGIALLLVLVLLPPVLIGLIVYQAIGGFAIQVGTRQIHSIAKAAESVYEDRLGFVQYALREIAAQAWVHEAISKKEILRLEGALANWQIGLGEVAFILLTDARGDILARPGGGGQGLILDPGGIVTEAAATGVPLASTELLSGEALAFIDSRLAQQATMERIETDLMKQGWRSHKVETRGMTQLIAVPVTADGSQTIGVLLAGILLNRDAELVDRIEDMYGVVNTIFLGDQRIATTVPGEEEGRALGTLMAADVVDVLYLQGKDYVGRAFIYDGWYYGHYRAIRNRAGEVIGSQLVSLPEAEFLEDGRLVQRGVVKVIIMTAIATVLLGTFLIFLVARSITSSF